MVDLSSPNEDSGSEVSGQSSVYEESDFVDTFVIRLTPQGKYTLEELKGFFDSAFENDSWLIASETQPQLHFHIVLETELGLDDLKNNIRSFLHIYWPDGQRPRGWGNAQYNCERSRELTPEELEIYSTRSRKAAAYALKDREEYIFNVYTQEWIDSAVALSFPKKSTKTFKSEYQSLCDEFYKTNMDIRQFMIDFAKLKSKYGQIVNLQHAYGYALSNLIKRDPDSAEEFVENFLYKQ